MPSGPGRAEGGRGQVRERLGAGRGVDVVLDMLGGGAVQRNLSLLAPGGRHVSVAFMQGSRAEVALRPCGGGAWLVWVSGGWPGRRAARLTHAAGPRD